MTRANQVGDPSNVRLSQGPGARQLSLWGIPLPRDRPNNTLIATDDCVEFAPAGDPMIKQAIARPAFAVSLIALAVIAMAMAPNPPALPPAPECTFTVDTPIPIGPEKSTVLLRFSAPLCEKKTGKK